MRIYQQRILLLVIPAILLAVIIGIFSITNSARYAYEACREVMLDEDGYGVWKLERTRFLFGRAQYDFSDGFNTARCEAVGFGKSWTGTKKMKTLVSCMLSLDDTGGNECPREKFGVTP